MSHSKRNTSLAFFTSHERAQLKSHWGSQSTRLTRDSFLPFASCLLCLLPSRAPVACACPSTAHIFCRECAISNLLTQKKEIKRLEREDARQQVEDAEQETRDDEEARIRAVAEFEKTQTGVAARLKNGKNAATDERVKSEGSEDEVAKGTKRKFELDEEEMVRIAKGDREKARRMMAEERDAASRTILPSFWVPSLTPSTSLSTTAPSAAEKLKRAPACPASTASIPHAISLKGLTDVKFTEEADPKDRSAKIRICPSCKKGLSNGSKATLTVPCGHVLCNPCTKQFTHPSNSTPDPHSPGSPSRKEKRIKSACHVCSLPSKRMVEISSEGTGFAGGGDNTVKKGGLVFQC